MANRSLFGLPREVFDELMACPLCCENYDGSARVAKFLPCLHGFCVSCLGRLVNDEPAFKCPVCRRDTDVPAGGVRSFSDNFIVTKLMDLRDLQRVFDVDMNKSQGLIRCGSCRDDNGAAVSFCSDADCVAFLCKNCDFAHSTMRRFEGHVVSSMEQLQKQPDIPLPRLKLLCEQHKHVLSVFCDEESCQRALCLVCCTTAHSTHRVIELDKKSEHVKEELQSLAKVAESKKVKVEEISGSISTEINCTSQRFTQMSSAVSAVFDDLQGQIRSRQDAAIYELKKLCFDRTNQLRHQTDLAESLASQFDSACQFAERACGIGNPVDLLKTRGQIISRLHELIALDVDKSLPFQPAGEKFLSFTAHHDRVLSEIERLVPFLGQFDTSPGVDMVIPQFKADFPGGVQSSVPVKSTQKVRISADGLSCSSFEGICGRVHAYLQSPDGSSTKCRDGKQHGDSYEFELQPLIVGVHQLSISVVGVPVTGSPFQVNVVERPSPGANISSVPSEKVADQVTASDVTWTDAFARCEHIILFKLRGSQSLHLRSGRTTSARYMIQDYTDQGEAKSDTAKAKDAYGQSRGISQPDSTEAHITETEKMGIFRIVYTPPAAGRLIMTIFVDGKPITSSPFVINVNPLHPGSTLVSACPVGKSFKDGAALDMPYSVVVQTRDYMGKQLTFGGYKVTATVITLDSSEEFEPHDVRDNQDGSYKVTFTPRSVKPHTVSIKICGYPVHCGRPLVLPVLDRLQFEDPPGGYTAPSGIATDKKRKVVYVADGKQGCIHRLASTDDCCVSTELAISVNLRKTLQIAVNASGKLVLLVPSSRCVVTYSTTGEEEQRWSCTAENVKPANITVSEEDRVVIGDTKSQSLFIYELAGKLLRRIQLPEGSLVAGVNNVCTDRKGNIVVATHSKPYQILQHIMKGNLLSKIDSPAQTTQLAAASTPGDALIVACLGRILVLEFSPDGEGATVVKEFQTHHIYTGLALAGDGCFLAIDPGQKHLAKYGYTLNQSANAHEVKKEMVV